MRKCANGSDIFCTFFCTSISFFLLAPGTCPNPPFIVFFFAWWHVLCNVQKSGFAAQTNTPENPEKHVKPLKRCLLTSPQIIFFSLGTCPKPREKRAPMHVISNWQTWLEGISEKALFCLPLHELSHWEQNPWSASLVWRLRGAAEGERVAAIFCDWWPSGDCIGFSTGGKSSRDLLQDISVGGRLCLIPPWKKKQGVHPHFMGIETLESIASFCSNCLRMKPQEYSVCLPAESAATLGAEWRSTNAKMIRKQLPIAFAEVWSKWFLSILGNTGNNELHLFWNLFVELWKCILVFPPSIASDSIYLSTPEFFWRHVSPLRNAGIIRCNAHVLWVAF